MKTLTDILSAKFGKAFAAQGLPSELGRVRVSDRPDLAQFQCNGAMAAAKQAKKNPRDVAQAVVDAMADDPDFAKLEIAGPGFLNIDLKDDVIAQHVSKTAPETIKLAAGETVVLDYGGPNIAKAMHVGHLRTAIIGDTMRRVMRAAGYKTIGDVHLGDWGTHLGVLIADYQEHGEESLITETDADDDAQVDRMLDDMAVRYPRASGKAKEDEAFKERGRAATARIQEKAQPEYGYWEIIRKVSVAGMKRSYDDLNVHFDLWYGESDAHSYIAMMADRLIAEGLAIEDDGATIVPVAEDSDKKEMPPLILYKRDGAVMYGTTDLATIVQRVADFRPQHIVYFVDQRQHLHFEQVFRAARKGRIAPPETELTFAGIGTVNGTDGKPFKTRAGGVMRLDDMIRMGREKAQARLAEANLAADMGDEEKDDIVQKVAVAAIKFADLQNQRQSDYIFDLDRMTSFEGKTGPYLLYQLVRINSLLRKAEEQGAQPSDALRVEEGSRALMLQIDGLADAMRLCIEHYAPHYLCDYLYTLAQQFAKFYNECHILSEQDEELKAARLALCIKTRDALAYGLALLGINAPARM